MKITVFTVVRFSAPVIRTHQSEISRFGPEREKWFQYRANLFLNTTAESFKNQIDEITKIFMIFTKGDELLFSTYFTDDLVKKLRIVPIFLDDITDHSDKNYLGFITQRYAREIKNPLILSRVDSDDLIANDYYKSIKSVIVEANLDKPKFIVCTNGFRTDLKYLQKTPYKKSPFICSFYPEGYLANSLEQISTGGSHDEIPDEYCIFTDRTSWVQIVHGTNLSNRFLFRAMKRVTPDVWPSNVYHPEVKLKIKGGKTLKLFILRLPFIDLFIKFALNE